MGVYKCPVCEGRGQVPAGFYHQYTSPSVVNTCPETCKSCSGRGVIFDTDCFYPHTNTPLPDDYTFSYDTICGSNSCSNCGHNDGMVYTSNPVKYKCTLNNQYHEAGHTCEEWCEKQLKLMQGEPGTFQWMGVDLSVTPRTDVTKLESVCKLNATVLEDATIEFVNGTNTTEQTAD
jgi:hypothetical protein